MKGRVLLLVLLLSVAVNLGVMGKATYHYCCRYLDAQEMSTVSRLTETAAYKDLELTSDQAVQMDQLWIGLRERVEPSRTRLRELRKEFLDLLSAQALDRMTIEAKVEEMNECQAQIEQAVAQHLLAEKQILSPDQQLKFLKMLERRFRQEDHHGTGTMDPLTQPGPPERHASEPPR